MSLKIAIGLSYYEDIESLKRSLPTYAPFVDFVIAMDGKYALRDGEDFSSKEVHDYLRSWPNVILEQFVGDENLKRQKILDKAHELKVDALIIIDSDEFVTATSNWKEFKKNLKTEIKRQKLPILNVIHHGDGDTIQMTKLPRIIRISNPPEIKYTDSHAVFKINEMTYTTRNLRQRNTLVEGLELGADDLLRSSQYMKQTRAYQVKLRDIEYKVFFDTAREEMTEASKKGMTHQAYMKWFYENY